MDVKRVVLQHQFRHIELIAHEESKNDTHNHNFPQRVISQQVDCGNSIIMLGFLVFLIFLFNQAHHLNSQILSFLVDLGYPLER